MKLVITKTKAGYSVADEAMQTVDIFPLTDEGQQRLVKFLCSNLINVEVE